MAEKNKAIIQMIICSIMWSIAGILFRFIDCNPFVIAGWRSFFSMITVFVFMKISKMKIHFTKNALLNAVFLSLTYFAFVSANKLTTAANAIVLQFTSPVFILLLSFFIFKKKIIRADVLAVAFTLSGIALFFFDKMDSGRLSGNLVGILSGIFMAAMYVFCGESGDDERMCGILLGHIITAAVGIAFTPFTQNTLDLSAFFWLAVLGVVQLGIPYILVGLALKSCPPLACCLIGVIEPLLNPLWVFLIDGEIPGTMSFVGATVILITITVWCIYKGRIGEA